MKTEKDKEQPCKDEILWEQKRMIIGTAKTNKDRYQNQAILDLITQEFVDAVTNKAIAIAFEGQETPVTKDTEWTEGMVEEITNFQKSNPGTNISRLLKHLQMPQTDTTLLDLATKAIQEGQPRVEVINLLTNVYAIDLAATYGTRKSSRRQYQ